MLRRCCICFFLLGALLPVIAAETCPVRGLAGHRHVVARACPLCRSFGTARCAGQYGSHRKSRRARDRQRYKMKCVKLSSGTLVPAIGVTVQF